jgi:predicted NAD/FAD-binding protein
VLNLGASLLQGKGGVYLAGAWAGYGFHEDGLKAGIAVAEALGATVPWKPRAASPKARQNSVPRH